MDELLLQTCGYERSPGTGVRVASVWTSRGGTEGVPCGVGASADRFPLPTLGPLAEYQINKVSLVESDSLGSARRGINVSLDQREGVYDAVGAGAGPSGARLTPLAGLPLPGGG